MAWGLCFLEVGSSNHAAWGDRAPYPSARRDAWRLLRLEPIRLDGKATSAKIKEEIAEEVNKRITNGQRAPHLAAVLVGNDGASRTYVNAKVKACAAVGFQSTLVELDAEISEQELLAGKNFGETSLLEIRELLAAHGLRIGMNLHKVHARDSYVDQSLTAEEQAALNRPIADLNLSVRSRKCMNRLAIQTIGQLISRTPDELLASRNFGVTSLNEIRLKLGEMSMKLRND